MATLKENLDYIHNSYDRILEFAEDLGMKVQKSMHRDKQKEVLTQYTRDNPLLLRAIEDPNTLEITAELVRRSYNTLGKRLGFSRGKQETENLRTLVRDLRRTINDTGLYRLDRSLFPDSVSYQAVLDVVQPIALGLGTFSTAYLATRDLAASIAVGAIGLMGLATSRDTRQREDLEELADMAQETDTYLSHLHHLIQ